MLHFEYGRLLALLMFLDSVIFANECRQLPERPDVAQNERINHLASTGKACCIFMDYISKFRAAEIHLVGIVEWVQFIGTLSTLCRITVEMFELSDDRDKDLPTHYLHAALSYIDAIQRSYTHGAGSACSVWFPCVAENMKQRLLDAQSGGSVRHATRLTTDSAVDAIEQITRETIPSGGYAEDAQRSSNMPDLWEPHDLLSDLKISEPQFPFLSWL